MLGVDVEMLGREKRIGGERRNGGEASGGAEASVDVSQPLAQHLVRGGSARGVVVRVGFARSLISLSVLALACSSNGGGGTPTADLDGGPDAQVSGGGPSPSGETDQPPTAPGASTHDASHPTTDASGGVPASSGDTAPSPTDTGSDASNPGTVEDDTTGDVDSVTSNVDTGTDQPTGEAPGDVSFEPPGGGFASTQQVALQAADGETIYYTLDGSLPTTESAVYDAPITLEATAVIRVMVSSGGVTKYFAQTYVLLDPGVVDFESDLPIIVIERHRDTPIERLSDELRPSSLLVFEPGEDGRSRLVGPADLSHRAGARVRGAYSRYFQQVGYALEAWAADVDEDEDISLLGMPPDADWVLSAPSEMDRALMRNHLVMDLSRMIGRYAPRAEFVELFLVDSEERDTLEASDYLGVYTAMEKIKRGPDRVNITKLRDTDVAGTALTGGYMFRIDHDENDFSAGGFDFGWVYPDSEEMLLPARQPQVDYMTGYMAEFFDCLGDDDFTNPTTLKHYSEYIDVPAWIDHHLINMMTKNVDGLRLSSYFFKDRNSLLVAGPVWDFDRSLGTPHDSRVVLASEWFEDDGTDHMNWGFWGQLLEDPAFAAEYWSRWDELREGAFSEQALVTMIDGYEAELTEARERHFERWEDVPPYGSPAAEVQIMRDWLHERLIWLDAQRP